MHIAVQESLTKQLPTDTHAHFAVFIVVLFIHLTLHSPPFLSSFLLFTSPFTGLPKHPTLPPLPHYPQWAPIPSQMSTNAIFIILVNTFDNSFEQLKGLPKRRMKLHLATEGTIMTCFSLFSAEEKLMCLNLFLSFFHQKRLVN